MPLSQLEHPELTVALSPQLSCPASSTRGKLPCLLAMPRTPDLLASENTDPVRFSLLDPNSEVEPPPRGGPPPSLGSRLTTHELVGAVDAVGEGVTLLLDEDALATGAAELVGQAEGCEEGSWHSEASEGAAWLPAQPPRTQGRSGFQMERDTRTLSRTGQGDGKSSLHPPLDGPCPKAAAMLGSGPAGQRRY